MHTSLSSFGGGFSSFADHTECCGDDGEGKWEIKVGRKSVAKERSLEKCGATNLNFVYIHHRYERSVHYICKVMIIFAFVAIIAALVCARGLAFVDFDIPPETVSQFDPTAYMGRWYQVYTSLVPRLTYEKNGVCVVADYLNPVVTDSSARFDILNSEK